jgi:hypothetical protein
MLLQWLREERGAYQTKKFDYVEKDPNEPIEHWMQQYNTYLSRIPLFGLDTPQGLQATLKLAATALACAEHMADKGVMVPKPGVSSGTIEEWQ